MSHPLQPRAAELARAVHESHARVPELIALLVEVGDLTPELAASAWLEPGSLEHECADLFHAGGITRVYFNGTIEQFPN